ARKCALIGYKLSNDARQEVVEVMTNTAGQLSHRLHLLGLSKLRLDALTLSRGFQKLVISRCQLKRTLPHLGFERLLAFPERGLGLLSSNDFILCRVIQTRLVHRDAGLYGDAGNQAL